MTHHGDTAWVSAESTNVLLNPVQGPNEIKEAVAGWGGADKDQVERMVRVQLGLETPLRPADAADAVAVAVISTETC